MMESLANGIENTIYAISVNRLGPSLLLKQCMISLEQTHGLLYLKLIGHYKKEGLPNTGEIADTATVGLSFLKKKNQKAKEKKFKQINFLFLLHIVSHIWMFYRNY